MALFILCRNGSSSSTRLYVLAWISLVLVCSFSYGSSAPLSGSSTVDIGNDVDHLNNEKSVDDKINHHYRLPFRSSASLNHKIDADDYPISSKNRFRNLLLQLALSQEGDRSPRQYQVHVDDRRYAPQSFHAMRG
jgi:hypothetical protein